MPTVAILFLVFALPAPSDAVASQYTMSDASGRVIEFTPEDLLAFRDRSDSLMTDLQEDPAVLYYPEFRPELEDTEPRDSWPWNVVEVVTDSLAAIVMPGNLREARRAYESYAVLRMHNVREDPDVACEVIVERELFAMDGFVDGWIVTRLLFGGPSYEALDELVFARAAGVLEGLVIDRENRQLGGCLKEVQESHRESVDAYREWRLRTDQ